MTSASPEISNRFIIERKQSGYCSFFLFSICKFHWIIFLCLIIPWPRPGKMLSEQYSPTAFPIIWFSDSPTLPDPSCHIVVVFFFSFLSFCFCWINHDFKSNRTVWVWVPHATTTRGRSFCNASSCFTVPLFSIYFKMKDLSATFHLPGTNILLRGLFLSVNQIARIC